MSDDDELVDIEVACRMWGGSRAVHESTIYRAIADGRFPKPIKLSPKMARWRPQEIRDAIKRRAEDRW